MVVSVVEPCVVVEGCDVVELVCVVVVEACVSVVASCVVVGLVCVVVFVEACVVVWVVFGEPLLQPPVNQNTLDQVALKC